MYATHNWSEALAIAIKRTWATGRRHRVRWSAFALCWTIAEVETP